MILSHSQGNLSNIKHTSRRVLRPHRDLHLEDLGTFPSTLLRRDPPSASLTTVRQCAIPKPSRPLSIWSSRYSSGSYQHLRGVKWFVLASYILARMIGSLTGWFSSQLAGLGLPDSAGSMTSSMISWKGVFLSFPTFVASQYWWPRYLHLFFSILMGSMTNRGRNFGVLKDYNRAK